MEGGAGPVISRAGPFLLDEKAYQTVKEAKQAVLEGKSRPEKCPEDVWEVLMEMYGKASS